MANRNQARVFYLVIFCIFTTYIGYLSLRNSADIKLIQREIGLFLHESPKTNKNNFLSVEDSLYEKLLVNESNCRIPDIDPFDPMGLHLFHKGEWVEECTKIHRHWTYRSGRSIIFNDTAMKEDGYDFSEVSCCYKIITRIEQTLQNYDVHADDLIEYSECHTILKKATEIITEEFFMIECSGKLPLPVLYRGFHGIAQPFRSNATLEKIQWWRNAENQLPPNILMIGTDTTSRINFERNMIKSRRALQDIGAIEMRGYTKAGESTRSAFSVMFTGYRDVDLDATCHSPKNRSYDKCPMIWRRFSEAKYLTAQSEDWPDLTAFSNPGFVVQPTDFYLRSLMNAGHDYGLPAPLRPFARLSTQWCIGHQTNDEVLMDYTEALMDMAHDERVPLFALSWSSTYPHHMDHNLMQLLDDTYAQFLRRLESKGYLENTILIFLSDHGQRYGPLRETVSGWYEDKLPNFWIKLPKKYQERFPQWEKALENNSRQLTSTFMVYWTLNHIIDTFSMAGWKPPLSPELNYPDSDKTLSRKYTQNNFFSEVDPKSGCDELGVPDVYCACHKLNKVGLDDPQLMEGAERAIGHLNRELPSECAQLKVGRLTGGARVEKKDVWIFVIGLITTPGDMALETQIQYFPVSQTFNNKSTVQRANQMDQAHIQCIRDKHWQLYCHCLHS